MTDALTLVMPLKAKAGLSRADFYDYWLNAHITLPARSPGITNIWIHSVSFDESKWPKLAGVSHRPDEIDDFWGVPEASFETLDGLPAFIADATVQMHDGINFLSEEITYRSLGGNTANVVDRTENPAPDGHDSLVRHLLFFRRRKDMPLAGMQRFVTERLVPAYAKAPGLLKLRSHIFEALEGTLDHPGVAMFKPEDKQYQAAVEMVFPDEEAIAAFEASPAWKEIATDVAKHFEAVHAARITRTVTTKYKGQITLVGVRGVAVADVIHRLGVTSQLVPECSKRFMKDAAPPLYQR